MESNQNGIRKLRYSLGALWIIDGLLQMQPGMFTKAFYGQLPNTLMPSTLQTVREDSAAWVTPLLNITQSVYTHFPILTNMMVILIQLILGILLCLGRTDDWVRIGAVGTVAWGFVIWLFGEGVSGFPSIGQMTFYAGFPGSAFVYVIAGFILYMWISYESWDAKRIYRLSTRFISILFIICAIIQILPQSGDWDKVNQMSLFGNSGFQPQPAFLSKPIMALTNWISYDHTIVVNFLEIALLLAAAGIVWWWEKWAGVFRGFVYVWLFVAWWFGMDFGFLMSGLSTDPNTPPILASILISQVGQGTSLSGTKGNKSISTRGKQELHS